MAQKTVTKLESWVSWWAKKNGIIDHGTRLAQADKTLEEAQEIKDAIAAEDMDKLKDGIGDTLVTLIIQAEMNGVFLADCLEVAWNEIKDREGEMVNGQFVRSKEQSGCCKDMVGPDRLGYDLMCPICGRQA